MSRNKHFFIFSLLTTIVTSMSSFNTFAETNIFTVLDDPHIAKKSFDGNAQISYDAKSGTVYSSNLAASSTMTWFRKSNAYSLFGEIANTSFNENRISEKYQLGLRARHNLLTESFLFAQGDWLSNRYDSYCSRYRFVAGYGRQIAIGPIHTLCVEIGSGMRHDRYQNGGSFTKALSYIATLYNYQLTNNIKFIQGLSLLANGDITANLETGINIGIKDHVAAKISYNIDWNRDPSNSVSKHTNVKTSISLVYKMQ